MTGGEGELRHPRHLGDVCEEHDQEPRLLHILKLGAHQSKHDQAGDNTFSVLLFVVIIIMTWQNVSPPIEQHSEPVVSQGDFHDEGGSDTVHLLQVVVAVQQRQAPDERHHHQLHRRPGLLLLGKWGTLKYFLFHKKQQIFY